MKKNSVIRNILTFARTTTFGGRWSTFGSAQSRPWRGWSQSRCHWFWFKAFSSGTESQTPRQCLNISSPRSYWKIFVISGFIRWIPGRISIFWRFRLWWKNEIKHVRLQHPFVFHPQNKKLVVCHIHALIQCDKILFQQALNRRRNTASWRKSVFL